MIKILFICKSNVGRSQMAEAFLKEIAPDYQVVSAGTHVAAENEGQPISKITEKVIISMKEVGHLVDDKIMNQLTPQMVEWADKVISITPKDTLPSDLQNSPKLEVWDIPDAGGTDLAFHAKVRDMVRENVKQLVVELS